jgi:heme-degrading monooxygenase HmoA
MDYSFWLTTRTIKPGTREQFEQSWRPAEFPPGLVGAYVLYAEQGDEVVGISIWDSAEACDGYRGSDIEARRRAAMGPSCSRNGRASRPAASWESQVADRLPARPSRLAAGREAATEAKRSPPPRGPRSLERQQRGLQRPVAPWRSGAGGPTGPRTRRSRPVRLQDVSIEPAAVGRTRG